MQRVHGSLDFLTKHVVKNINVKNKSRSCIYIKVVLSIKHAKTKENSSVFCRIGFFHVCMMEFVQKIFSMLEF